MPRAFVESAEGARCGAAVEAAGGTCEGFMGGLLRAHLPPEGTFGAEAALAAGIAAARGTPGDAAREV